MSPSWSSAGKVEEASPESIADEPRTMTDARETRPSVAAT